MLRLQDTPHDRRAKDGEIEMSLGMSRTMVGVERLAGGRRTVTTWLRAAGVSDDFQDYYYLLACVGRKSESITTQLGGAGTLIGRKSS